MTMESWLWLYLDGPCLGEEPGPVLPDVACGWLRCLGVDTTSPWVWLPFVLPVWLTLTLLVDSRGMSWTSNHGLSFPVVVVSMSGDDFFELVCLWSWRQLFPRSNVGTGALAGTLILLNQAIPSFLWCFFRVYSGSLFDLMTYLLSSYGSLVWLWSRQTHTASFWLLDCNGDFPSQTVVGEAGWLRLSCWLANLNCFLELNEWRMDSRLVPGPFGPGWALWSQAPLIPYFAEKVPLVLYLAGKGMLLIG